MEIRVHTEQTLRSYMAGVLLVSIGLSAALLAPPAYVRPITTVVALGALVGCAALQGTMMRRTADFSLVPRAERRRFLVENTAWMAATLIAYGLVFAHLVGGGSVPLGPGLGQAALIVGAISAFMMARTAMAHGRRVAVPGER